MPKFKIIELVREEREVEAATAQEALDNWVNDGIGAEPYVEVQARHVEDENGRPVDTEDS